MQRLKKILKWIAAILILMSIINITTWCVKVTSSLGQTPTANTTQVTPKPSGPQFDVWMDGKQHTTSKEYYSGSIGSSEVVLTMRGTLPDGYIDNMFSWDKSTGVGLWKSEFHPNKGPGQRADGTTQVVANADGKTYQLQLFDKDGAEYGIGKIVPVVN